MIHEQDPWGAGRFYAYCKCGVCGPLRPSAQLAEADEQAHAEVCSEAKR